MKKGIMLLLAICGYFVTIAQNKNFSGVWLLDKSNSKMDERTASITQRQTITAVQTEKEIRVNVNTEQTDGKRKVDLGAGEAKIYRFDGTELIENRDTQIGPIKIACKGAFENNQLKLRTVHTFNNTGAEITTITNEVWSLSNNGTILIVKKESETPRGMISSELVYKKDS